MRVTNTSISRNYMFDNQENLQKMSKLNERINSGKYVNRVSDDPFKAVRIMNLDNEIKFVEKYNYNIDETVGWMNTTDSSLEHLGKVLGDIKNDILKVGNGTYSQEEMKAIQKEMNEKIQEFGESLNTTYAGKYMFGGTNVDQPPVKVETGANGAAQIKVLQKKVDDKGDPVKDTDGNIIYEYGDIKDFKNLNTGNLQSDISDGINMDYNVSVGELFKGKDKDGTEINFLEKINEISNTIAEIANEVDSDGNPIDEAAVELKKKDLVGTLKDSLDKFANHTLDERTSLGVRVNTAEKVKDLNNENILSMKGVRSLDQDVDYVEKFIELASAEMIYQASVQVGAKLIQPSILDYLR